MAANVDPAALAALPWRAPAGPRPDLPLPPEPMPVRFAGGWRKRWRYVSAFGDELMLFAASVQIGPAAQTFWAVLDRSSGELHERTRMRLPGARGEVWNEDANGRPLEIGFEVSQGGLDSDRMADAERFGRRVEQMLVEVPDCRAVEPALAAARL